MNGPVVALTLWLPAIPTLVGHYLGLTTHIAGYALPAYGGSGILAGYPGLSIPGLMSAPGRNNGNTSGM